MSKLTFGEKIDFGGPKYRGQFQTIEQVWEAIDAGKTVYWGSDAYQLTIEEEGEANNPESMAAWRIHHGYPVPFSARGTKALRVTCISNWFGSLLSETELGALYTK